MADVWERKFFLLYCISYGDKFRNADKFNSVFKCVITGLNTYGFKQARENCVIIIEFRRDTDELFNILGIWEYFIERNDSCQINTKRKVNIL